MPETDFLEDLKKQMAAGAPAPEQYGPTAPALPPADPIFDQIKQNIAAGVPKPGAYGSASMADDSDDVPASQAAALTAKPAKPASSDDDDEEGSTTNPVLKQYLQDKLQLRQAQAQAKQNQEATGLTSALVQLSHGLARAPGSADLSAVQAMAKNDNAPITNALAQQSLGDTIAKSERADEVGDKMRPVYKKLLEKAGYGGMDLDDMDADEMKQYLQNPAEFADKMQERREASEQRASIANAAAQDRADKQRDANDHRDQKEADKMAAALKADLDPNGGRAGNMGKNQARVDAADRLEGLLKQTGGNPDRRQIEELAIGAQNMLANGNGSAEQVKQLVPSSAWGDAKKLYEWFSNNPTGTDQQKFVARMGETIAREKQIAGDQVRTAQVQRLASHTAYKKRFPGEYGSQLQAYGIDPANIKEGRYVSPGAAPVKMGAAAHPDADEARKWAEANPDDPAAKAILARLNGSKPGAPL